MSEQRHCKKIVRIYIFQRKWVRLKPFALCNEIQHVFVLSWFWTKPARKSLERNILITIPSKQFGGYLQKEFQTFKDTAREGFHGHLKWRKCSVISVYSMIIDTEKPNLLYEWWQVKTIVGHERVGEKERKSGRQCVDGKGLWHQS